MSKWFKFGPGVWAIGPGATSPNGFYIRIKPNPGLGIPLTKGRRVVVLAHSTKVKRPIRGTVR